MNLTNKKIAVIGDIALDFYYFTHRSSETSVETSLPVNYVDKFTYSPGGAGNLAVNIAALGASCDLYGLCGQDIWADILKKSLQESGINTDGYIGCNGFSTFVYHKIYDDEFRELPRYDFGGNNIYHEEYLSCLLKLLADNLCLYDMIVINQQFSNSIHTPYFQSGLSKLLAKATVPVWMDSREPLSYPNCSCKMNLSEARARSGKQLPEDCAREICSDLFFSNGLKPSVVITLGENGALCYDGSVINHVPGINAIWQTDTVGAGDAFLSGLVGSLCSGENLPRALSIANCSAAVSTKTLHGTGHPKMEEIESMLSDPDYRYRPELAEDLRLAYYLPGTDIEIINQKIRFSEPKAAIFDHDGTISTIRNGWEQIMRAVMLEAIAGSSISNLSVERINGIYQVIDQMIEKTTGVQTIVQMEQLVDMVHHFGYVPEEEIKAAAEYKNIYTTRLNDMVREKYLRFKKGINNISDFTMKGSLDYIAELYANGTRIFLASGTDYDDVRQETDTFGTTHLFTGGIFGSVNNLSCDPKKLVMRNIIKEIDACPDEVIVFGDGPVEIREGRKHGFLTVGVLSDEKQRFGINLRKRERLVLAGADILIPDFSWIPALRTYLGGLK